VTAVDAIAKRPGPVAPNFADYDAARNSFSWEAICDELRGPDGRLNLNIASVAVDRHAAGGRCNHLAIRWLGKRGQTVNFTYGAAPLSPAARPASPRAPSTSTRRLNHYMTGKYALDLHPDDVFWCTADPGWVTGTSYGIISPLTARRHQHRRRGRIRRRTLVRILSARRSVWYTAPTAIRMLMKAGTGGRAHDLSGLRFIASVGEPLNPEGGALGARRPLDLPIHDNWWQTETGGIMIANYAAMDIRPGSMGKPLPGIEAAIVKRSGRRMEVIEEPDMEGDLALKPGWPSMFRGYLNEHERYREVLRRRLVHQRRPGPARRGRLLLVRRPRRRRHQDGRPSDRPVRGGERPHGTPGRRRSRRHRQARPDRRRGGESLRRAARPDAPGTRKRLDILGFARKRLGPPSRPRKSTSPTRCRETRSGKIMRRLLKARELGLPEGDTSTLEGKED
jgi:acetyl-CoA synthetase